VQAVTIDVRGLSVEHRTALKAALLEANKLTGS
jgi:hypothetical protein